jgi:hypothetical protein
MPVAKRGAAPSASGATRPSRKPERGGLGPTRLARRTPDGAASACYEWCAEYVTIGHVRRLTAAVEYAARILFERAMPLGERRR